MIQGTPEDVQAVANTDNVKSGLPLASPDYPCQGPLRCVDCGTVADYGATRCAVCPVLVDTDNGPVLQGGELRHEGCGYHLIEVADYEAETVRCMACGAVTPAGDRAATIQVRKVKKVDKTTAEYEASEDLEAAITAAKAKPDKDKDEKDKALAKVEVVKPPKDDDKPKVIVK